MTSRRALLATIATGSLSIGGATIAGGQDRGRDTIAENGFVVQFEDCQTVHVRGRRPPEPIRVLARLYYNRDGTVGLGSAVFLEPELPLTITPESGPVQTQYPGMDLVIFYQVDIQAMDRSQMYVREARPDDWQRCRQLVIDDANADGGDE